MTLSPHEQKEVLKQALSEWLDTKFAAFGKWSLGGIAAITFAALAYWVLTSHGWKPPVTN